MSSNNDTQYKVKYGCESCGRVRTTKWKDTKSLPHRCHKTENGEGCGKSRVNLSLHKIWKKGPNGEKILVKHRTGKKSGKKGGRYWS